MVGDWPECSQLNPKFRLSRPRVWSRYRLERAQNGWFRGPGGIRLPVSIARPRLFDLIDELRAEFAADSPCQAALARAAGRQYHRESGRDLEMSGDPLDAASRDVRDHAITRQRAGPELDLGDPSAHTTFACASIH